MTIHALLLILEVRPKRFARLKLVPTIKAARASYARAAWVAKHTVEDPKTLSLFEAPRRRGRAKWQPPNRRQRSRETVAETVDRDDDDGRDDDARAPTWVRWGRAWTRWVVPAAVLAGT